MVSRLDSSSSTQRQDPLHAFRPHIQERTASLRQKVDNRIARLESLLPGIAIAFPNDVVKKTEELKERIQYLRDLNPKRMAETEAKWILSLFCVNLIGIVVLLRDVFRSGQFVLTRSIGSLGFEELIKIISDYRSKQFREACIRVNRSIVLPPCPKVIAPDRLPTSAMEAEGLFREVTRRIPDFDETWHKRLAELPYIDERMAFISYHARDKDFATLWNLKSGLLEDADFQLYLVTALRRGVLTQHEFGTLLRYQQCDQFYKEHHQTRPKCFALFSPTGELCAEASQILFLSLKKKGRPLFEEEEQKRFIELARDLSPLEQSFLMVPDTIGFSQKTVVEGMLELGYNLFFQIADRSQTWQIEASVGLYQTLYRVLNPHYPVLLNPVLNISSSDDLRFNQLTRRRDVGLLSVFCKETPLADGLFAPNTQFPKHDGYHAFLINKTPVLHSELIIKIEVGLKDFKHTETIREFLVDGEFPAYFTHFTGREFWVSLMSCICDAHDKRMNEGLPLMSVAEELDLIRVIIMIALGNEEGTPEIHMDCLENYFLETSFVALREPQVSVEEVIQRSRRWDLRPALSPIEKHESIKFKMVVFFKVYEELRKADYCTQ